MKWLKNNIMRFAAVLIVVYTAILIGRNIVAMVRTQVDINRLKRERAEYLRNIVQDSVLLEHLQYDEYLEKYAREHYHLQRPMERVFIIEDKE